MTINIRDAADVTTLAPQGKMTYLAGAAEVAVAIANERRAGRHKLVLDMAQVSYIDSDGLEAIRDAFDLVHPQPDQELKLLNVPRHIYNLLVVTKLSPLFDIHESEQAALAAFDVYEPAVPRTPSVAANDSLADGMR